MKDLWIKPIADHPLPDRILLYRASQFISAIGSELLLYTNVYLDLRIQLDTLAFCFKDTFLKKK
jgi:hypothetical protein